MTRLAFTEEMKGYVAFGQTDFDEGLRKGKESDTFFMFHLTMEVDDVDSFVADPTHEARARGWVKCEALGGRLGVDRGIFNLFVDSEVEGRSHMLYRLFFTDGEGHPLTMTGFKVVEDDPNLDVWPDTTTLFVRILAGHVAGDDDAGATVVAAGKIRIYLLDFARQLTTFRVSGGSPAERARALTSFGRLFVGKLWDTYAPPARASRRELRHEVIIDAPVERVWAVLADTGSWADWNPTYTRADGPLVEGTEVKMRLRVGRLRLRARQRIRVVEAPHLVRWTARLGPAFLEVDRSFELEGLSGGRTHLAQYETGSTWLASKVVPLLEKPVEAGYAALASALAARVHATVSGE